MDNFELIKCICIMMDNILHVYHVQIEMLKMGLRDQKENFV